jgi:PilZ domain
MSSRAVSAPRAVVGRSLLVSNDSSIVHQLTTILQQFAISSDACSDPVTAVTLINTRKFEVVVVDFGLGEHAGYVLECVRLSPSNQCSVTFGLVSAEEEQDLQALPNFVVRKPLSESEIGSILKAALGLVIRDYRRYFRCPLTASLLIRIDGKAQIPCEMMNVSEGGLAAATPVMLVPGTIVEVGFALPGEPAKFDLEAEVCWCDHKGHVGVQFRSVPQETSLLLQGWLSRKIEEGIPEPVARLFHKYSGNSETPSPE